MMLLKCCTQHASKFGKLSSGHRTKRSIFISIPKKGTIKDRNDMDLTEQKILRKGGKNTQNYIKKILMTEITSMV